MKFHLFIYLFQLDNSQYDGPNPDEDEDSEMDSDSEEEESDREGQNHQGQTDEEPLGSDDDINEGSDGEIFETGLNDLISSIFPFCFLIFCLLITKIFRQCGDMSV